MIRTIRGLLRTPIYTVVAVLTLALGIGASTAAYTVLHGVLLAPLPYTQPNQLFGVWSRPVHDTAVRLLSYPDFQDYARQQDVFTGMGFSYITTAVYRRPRGGTTVYVGLVNDDFFPVLGAKPVVGRLLTAADNQPGAAPVTVITHEMWVNNFAGDPSVVGRDIDLSIGHYTIVGVLGVGAGYPEYLRYNDGSLYVPLWTVPAAMHSALGSRLSHSDTRAIARLKPGITPREAERHLGTIAARLALAYPTADSNFTVQLKPLQQEVEQGVGGALTILAAAVAFVLLLATADVANLGLVRATGRAREIAVRTALGASRARVIREMLVESGVIAVAAGVLGVAFAIIGVKVLDATAQNYLPRLDEVHLDLSALGAALVATAVAALLAALAPIAVSRRDILPALKAGGRGSSSDRRSVRLRSAIVIGQVALSVVLVTGAGLMIRSFALLRSVNPGYDPSHLIAWDFDTPEARSTDPEARLAVLRRISDAMQVPGVQSVVFANHVPLEFGAAATPVGADGRDYKADTAGAIYEVVSPGYFATMHIPVIEGREFTDADLSSATVPALVSATAAKRYWPDADPVGHAMTVTSAVHFKNPDFGKPIQTTVVGVVADVKKFSLDETTQPAVYLPITHPVPAYLWAVVRTVTAPKALVPTLARKFAAIDPDLVPRSPLSDEPTRIETGLAGPIFIMSVLGLFSTLALVLAALGLYGVIAYSVTQRTSELGIRVALGAHAADIVRLVAQHATTLVVAGLALGACGAFVLGRAMRSLLYGVGPSDPTTLLTVAAILAAITAVASYAPARRAARVEPMIALRSE